MRKNKLIGECLRCGFHRSVQYPADEGMYRVAKPTMDRWVERNHTPKCGGIVVYTVGVVR